MTDKLTEVGLAIEKVAMATYDEHTGCSEILNPDECAKAAIEAMREPTDEMLEAAFEAVYYEESLLGDWLGWADSNRKRWRAMIDKALEGKDAQNS